MNSVLSDDILKHLRCSLCSEYLSVLPVKVYPNRKVKCGRCTVFGDAGADSLYKVIAPYLKFPCVNKFEGCSQILRTSETFQHENKCISKTFKCIFSDCSEEIRMSILIRHFENAHRNNIIRKPEFSLTRHAFKRGYKVYYVFPRENIMFLIKALCLDEKSINIDVGVMFQDILHKNISYCCEFVASLHSGSAYLSNKVVCSKFPTKVSNGGIELHNSLVSSGPVLCRIHFDNVVFLNLQKMYLSRKHSKFTQTDLSLDTYKPRNKIYLSASFKNKYNHLKITPCNRSIILNNCFSPGALFCDYCGDYNITYFSNILTCYVCRECHKSLKLLFSDFEETEFEFLNELMYYCKWCNEKFYSYQISSHEIECHNRNEKHCPVKDCKWFGKLNDMENHIKSHPNSFFNGNIYLEHTVNVLRNGTYYYLFFGNIWVKVNYKIKENDVKLHSFYVSYDSNVKYFCYPVVLVRKEKELLGMFTEYGSVNYFNNCDLYLYVFLSKK